MVSKAIKPKAGTLYVWGTVRYKRYSSGPKKSIQFCYLMPSDSFSHEGPAGLEPKGNSMTARIAKKPVTTKPKPGDRQNLVTGGMFTRTYLPETTRKHRVRPPKFYLCETTVKNAASSLQRNRR